MKQSLLNKMQTLEAQGYVFTRVAARYDCEQLLPDQMDAKLDSVLNTPAFVKQGQLHSDRRVLLVVQNPAGEVKWTVQLGIRGSERMLSRCLNQL